MTPEDRNQVERFSAFLRDAGPAPNREGYDPKRATAAYRKHYPEDAERVLGPEAGDD